VIGSVNRQITVDNIQKTVAEYFKIKVADLFSKKRTRVIVRPRQIAMWLAKNLTSQSYPSIGRPSVVVTIRRCCMPYERLMNCVPRTTNSTTMCMCCSRCSRAERSPGDEAGGKVVDNSEQDVLRRACG
jgi:hypothetical protein